MRKLRFAKVKTVILCAFLCTMLCIGLTSCALFSGVFGEPQDESEHEHKYTATVTQPTCESGGFTTYVCDCGHSYIGDYTSNGSHSYGEWLVVKEANCLTEGEMRRECACGSTEIKTVPDLGHVGTASVKNPSCVEDGYTIYNCKTCGNSYVDDYVFSNGHTYGDWVAVQRENCTKSGQYIRECVFCGNSQTKTASALGHQYTDVGGSSDGEAKEWVCIRCNDKYSGSETVKPVHETEITAYDCEIDYVFNVISEKGYEYIVENIKIYDAYFKGSKYEQYGLVNFAIEPIQNDSYAVKADYSYGRTYVIELSGDVVFEGSGASKLTLTIKNDPNHQNVAKYRDDILFLKSLEQKSPGYYPYQTAQMEGSDSLYLIIPKVDGLALYDIICIGDLTSFDGVDPMAIDECYIGKISEINKIDSKNYIVRLDVPDLNEVFVDFGIIYDDYVNFDENAQINENLKEDVVNSLYEDDDFIAFLNSANLAARTYANERGYSVTQMAATNFFDNASIDPEVRLDGTTVYFTINGNINVPLKSIGGKEIGSIDIVFKIEASAMFEMGLSYRLKYWWFIPTGLKEFDLSFNQGSSIGFEFDISIKAEYSLDEDEQVSHPFIKNVESGRVHVHNCLYVTSIKDDNQKLEMSADEAHAYLSEHPDKACQICKPKEGLERSAFALNTQLKVIHAYNCYHANQISDKNYSVTVLPVDYWVAKGYDCCDWCKPQEKERESFKEEMQASFEYSDWSDNFNKISVLAASSGTSGSNEAGITIAHIKMPVFVALVATVKINFVLDFKLEASFNYKYAYEQSNLYGVRLNEKGVFEPYSESYDEVKEHSIELMGHTEMRIGFAVDANISIVLIGPWANAGLTAGVGCYARAVGIYIDKNLTEPGADFAAAYFEMGIYVKVEAYYTILFWHGEITIINREFPLIIMGYDTAYYAYTQYVERIELGVLDPESEQKTLEYNIDLEDLLLVEYYDLKTFTKSTTELKLTENDDYKVIIEFASGEYISLVDGVVVVKEDAPCGFTDTMIIKVVGTDDWWSYEKGNAVFYLKDYYIDIEYNGDNHDWKLLSVDEATCDTAGKEYYACSKCLFARGSTIDPLGHDWREASCNDAKTCERCQITEGEALGHDWREATCTESKTCVRCEAKDGDPSGHNWQDATCITPAICLDCGLAEGEALGHDWREATCTESKTCVRCEAKDGDPSDHNWQDATCLSPKTCLICGLIEGSVADHNYVNGVCTECNASQYLPVPYTITVKYYIKNGDEFSTDMVEHYSYFHGDSYEIKVPQKIGYIPNVNKFVGIMGAKNTEFEVVYSPITYSVAYNANGGSGEMISTTMFYDAGAYLPEMEFTRQGYTFNGWNTKADGSGTRYRDRLYVKNLSSNDGEVIVLYAQWKLNEVTYTVTYLANKPENASNEVKGVPNSETWTYSKDHALAYAPSLRGWIFEGWYDDSGKKISDGDDLTTEANVNVNLYAHWRPITFNVFIDIYDYNTVIEVKYDEEYVLSWDNYWKEQFAASIIFDGWYYCGESEEYDEDLRDGDVKALLTTESDYTITNWTTVDGSYVYFYGEAHSEGTCVTADTLITLADGSQVRVDELKGDEILLVWNLETGMLDESPIMFIDFDEAASYEIIHLYFSDGTEVKVIAEHGFWDYDLNQYVYLDENAENYIGHSFAKQSGDRLSQVQLLNVVIENEVEEAWSPVTETHLCYFVNGMLSMPGGATGLINIFDVDAETMTYNYDSIARDVEMYGLFTYEELNSIVELPEEMFYEAGGMYLKISIAKGNITMDDLIAVINRYKCFF